MAIGVNKLFDEKLRKFGQSASHARFQQDFICALGYVLDDIDNLIGISETRPTSTNATLTLDEKAKGVISAGIDVNLNLMGEYQIGEQGLLQGVYDSRLKEYHARYSIDQVNVSKLGDVGYTTTSPY